MDARVDGKPSQTLADPRNPAEKPKRRKLTAAEKAQRDAERAEAARIKAERDAHTLAANADMAARIRARPKVDNRPKAKKGGKKRTAARARTTERAAMRDEAGAMHAVERFVDTIENMYRRRQIDARQYQAAETYRDAAERVEGGIPCPLDTSRVRTGTSISSPTESQLWAAAMLAEAERILGKIDGRIVAMVTTAGHSVHEVARQLFGAAAGKPRRGDAEHVGRRLREALTALADAWWPAPPQGRIRAVRDETDPAMASSYPQSIEPGVVAHAARGRVRFSKIGG